MDVNELVATIAREVLKQLRGESAGDCVTVLADRDCLLDAKLRECLGGDCEFFYFGDDLRDRKPGRFILPFLSCSDMADMASGKASGPCMSEVLRLLLHGTEVEVLEFEYRAHAETAPGPLYSLYESHEDTLAGFGLRAFRPKRPDTVRFRETLVTEAVVNEAGEQGASVLMVPVTAQVTPLAAEAAVNLNITIRKSL